MKIARAFCNPPCVKRFEKLLLFKVPRDREQKKKTGEGIMRIRIVAALTSSFLIAAGCINTDGSTSDSSNLIAAASADEVEEEFTLWRPGTTEPRAEAEFKTISDATGASGGRINLANGSIVQLSDWPATVMSQTGGICTASLIGPELLLTAAHCVDGGGVPASVLGGTIELNLGSRIISNLDCQMHEEYQNASENTRGGVRSTRDYALCRLEQGPLPLGVIEFESIDVGTSLLPRSDILMSGFGCTRVYFNLGGRLTLDRSTGLDALRMGDNKINAVKQTAGSLEANGVFAVIESNNQEPTICPGDSGGPVFSGATLSDQNASRRIVAVNSAVGGRIEANGAQKFFSYVSPLADPAFVDFLEDYLSDQPDLQVCGWNTSPGLKGCRP